MNELLIFVHVPKTAGTSLVEALKRDVAEDEALWLYGIDRTSDVMEREIERLPARRRAAIRVVGGHQAWYGVHRLFPDREPRYITFLRNPVARVISDYYKILRTPRNALHERMTREGTTLETFLGGGPTPMVMNHMTVFLGRDRVTAAHNVDQCSLDDAPLLKRAIDNLRSSWFVGLTESYAADLARLAELTGLPLAELHVNKPPRVSSERRNIAPELVRRCAEINRMDGLLYDHAVLVHENQAPQPFGGAPLPE